MERKRYKKMIDSEATVRGVLKYTQRLRIHLVPDGIKDKQRKSQRKSRRYVPVEI